MTDRLPLHFYTMPQTARMTVTRAEAKALLLHHDGQILACGHLWNIKTRNMGAGVYEVTLKEWKP